MCLHLDPIPGVPIVEPEIPPGPNDILLGYELVKNETKTFRKPDLKNMQPIGWIGVLLSVLIFWPVSCVPCFMSCSYSDFQRPVYGPATNSTVPTTPAQTSSRSS